MASRGVSFLFVLETLTNKLNGLYIMAMNSTWKFMQDMPSKMKNHLPDNQSDDGVFNQGSGEDEEDDTGFSRCVAIVQKAVRQFVESYSATMWLFFYILLLIGYFTYFGFAMYHRWDG